MGAVRYRKFRQRVQRPNTRHLADGLESGDSCLVREIEISARACQQPTTSVTLCQRTDKRGAYHTAVSSHKNTVACHEI